MFLQASQRNLLLQDDHFELIIDSGCSKVVSPDLNDFIPGSLKNIPILLAMEEIAGQLLAKKKEPFDTRLLTIKAASPCFNMKTTISQT